MASGKLNELFDLAIVGGGPAGAAAAFRAASDGASVLVVERDKFPNDRGGVAWMGPAGVALCGRMKIGAKQVGAAEFCGLRLHSWDLKKTADVREPKLSGWTINRSAFEDALLKCAIGSGALAVHGAELSAVSLGEERAELGLSDGRNVAARIVVIADGAASDTCRLANIVPAARNQNVSTYAFVEYEGERAANGLDVAMGSGRDGLLATVTRFGNTVRIAVSARLGRDVLNQHFCDFRRNAIESGLAPAGAPEEPLHAISPAGVALDMDTHVGKRCLLTGDAGGFVAAFSQEGVYPAMRSGWIAAETALRALKADLCQDELATFGSSWRGDLADYLRMPNTDLSLLAPLVFNNEQMSLRVARAFLLGQPF